MRELPEPDARRARILVLAVELDADAEKLTRRAMRTQMTGYAQPADDAPTEPIRACRLRRGDWLRLQDGGWVMAWNTINDWCASEDEAIVSVEWRAVDADGTWAIVEPAGVEDPLDGEQQLTVHRPASA